jgi:hypothetical protein
MDRRQLLFGASALGLVTNLNLNHPLIAQVGNAVMGSRRLSDRERTGLRGPVKTCSDLIGGMIQSVTTEYSPDGRLLGYRVRVPVFPRGSFGVGFGGILGGADVVSADVTYEFYDEQSKRTTLLTVPPNPDVTDGFHYDKQGKKTRVRTISPRSAQPGFTVILDSRMLEVTEGGGSLSGGGSVTTHYNHYDQPIESLVRNANGELLTKIDHNYANGRLTSETLVIVRENFEATRQMQERFSDGQEWANIAKRRAFLGQLQGLRMERSYDYDNDDRVIRRLTQMGDFKEEESKTFNEQGDEDWTLMIRNGVNDERSEFRYLYQYDSHGNWTERTTINTDQPGNPNTQRRTLAYY